MAHPIPMAIRSWLPQPLRMAYQSALRNGRHSICGQLYHVTFSTFARRRHFDDWAVASDAARQLTSAHAWVHSRLLAWVLMPDHFHGLIELGEADALSSLVGSCKGRTARALRLAHPSLGAIWSRGFHDRAVRTEDDALTAARYLVMNPIRAGLVARAGDYPFWDAVWL